MPVLLLCFFLLLSPPVVIAADPSPYSSETLEAIRAHRLSAKGFGPVMLGMTIEEASSLLEVDIRKTPFAYGADECHSWAIAETASRWLVRFITRDGRIEKIDVFGTGMATSEGAKVGGSLDEAVRAFPDGNMKPAHDPSERVWRVPVGRDRYIAFLAMFRSIPPVEDVPLTEGTIRIVSVGVDGVGTVEGCL